MSTARLGASALVATMIAVPALAAPPPPPPDGAWFGAGQGGLLFTSGNT